MSYCPGGGRTLFFVTLVGCFVSDGIPAMVGDFLITSAGKPTGFRKKLRRLSPNVVMGWTGNLLSAEAALDALGPQLARPALRDEVQAALLSLDASAMVAPLKLVGWVVEDQPHAFLWDSTTPSLVHWGGPWYVGSGGKVIERTAGGSEGLRGPAGHESFDPLISVLEVATYLMADEVLGRQGLRSLNAGHACELLWWTGDSFQYIDDVLYATVQVAFDDSGSVERVQLLEPSFKYFVAGETSVVTAFRPSSRETLVNIAPPVGLSDHGAVDVLVSELGKPGALVPLRSTFYALFLDIRARGYLGPMFALTARHDDQPDPPMFSVTESGELDISFSSRHLEWMYRLVRQDQARGHLLASAAATGRNPRTRLTSVGADYYLVGWRAPRNFAAARARARIERRAVFFRRESVGHPAA